MTTSCSDNRRPCFLVNTNGQNKAGQAGPIDVRADGHNGQRGWKKPTGGECPICEITGWCQVSSDETVAMCRRQPNGAFKTKNDQGGIPYYLHRLVDLPEDSTEAVTAEKPTADQVELADVATRHAVYTTLLNSLNLSAKHFKDLQKRGLTDTEISRRNYGTFAPRSQVKVAAALSRRFGKDVLLRVPGFYVNDQSLVSTCVLAGLMVPVRDTEERIIGLKVRPDEKLDRGTKYLWVSSKNHGGPSPGNQPHVPLGVDKTSTTWRLTEGELKADISTAISGIPTISAPGIGAWNACLPILKAVGCQTVRLAPDADTWSNPHVGRAVVACRAALKTEGFNVELERWEPAKGKGIDDILAAHGVVEILTGDDVDRAVAEAVPDNTGQKLPKIFISTNELYTNDEAVAAVVNDPNLFSLGYVLATVIKNGDAPRGVEYLDGLPPRLAPIASATLQERMSASAQWVKIKETRDGQEIVPAHPPAWSVAAVMERGHWPGLRRIVGVIESPTIRRDGSILDTPGYDVATGLFYAPSGEFGKIPSRPTLAQVKAAVRRILDLVSEFPFLDDNHMAAWLAALLTVLVRAAIDGPVPLFAFDGNCPGSGKSMLADLIAVIFTGRRMSRTIWPHGRDADEEMRKRITSLLLAGELFTLLDNVAFPYSLGGAPLDALLTSTTWKDRILGRSQTTGELPNRMVCFASGNNLQLGTDIIRRVIPCRLVSPLESPEDRADFKYPDLIGHARANRGAYLADGLTIIRGYFEAGLPGTVKALGSYESWSRIIVGAVQWATELNPCQPRELVKAEDTGSQRRQSLFLGLSALDGIKVGLTAGQILQAVRDEPTGPGDRYVILREVLLDFGKKGEFPDSRAIGEQLRGMKDRVIEVDKVPHRLTAEKDTAKKVAKWVLSPIVAARGETGSYGVACGHPAKAETQTAVNQSNGEPQREPVAKDPVSPRTTPSTVPAGRSRRTL